MTYISLTGVITLFLVIGLIVFSETIDDDSDHKGTVIIIRYLLYAFLVVLLLGVLIGDARERIDKEKQKNEQKGVKYN